jgi:hypothetical protein
MEGKVSNHRHATAVLAVLAMATNAGQRRGALESADATTTVTVTTTTDTKSADATTTVLATADT